MLKLSMKKGEIKSKNLFLIIGIVAVIIALVLIAVFIFTFEKNTTKKDLSGVNSESKESTEKSELGTISPLGENENNSQEETESVAGRRVSGGGSVASSQSISALGKLEIINKIDPPYTNHACDIVHWGDATEEADDYDHIYGAMYNPSNIAAKIISDVDGTELDVDSRPLTSMSIIYLELSLMSSSGGTVSIESANSLVLSLPLEGYEFEGKTLTLQQYDYTSRETLVSYNVRDVINNQGGIIELEDITGSHDSGVPYAYFKLSFS